jgi:hypothetical protein
MVPSIVVQRGDRLGGDERDAVGRRGREFVVDQFSFRAYSRRLEQLIEQATQVVKG